MIRPVTGRPTSSRVCVCFHAFRLCLRVYTVPYSCFISSQTRSVVFFCFFFGRGGWCGREVSRNRCPWSHRFGNMTHCLFTQNLVEAVRVGRDGSDPGASLKMQTELKLKQTCQKQDTCCLLKIHIQHMLFLCGLRSVIYWHFYPELIFWAGLVRFAGVVWDTSGCVSSLISRQAGFPSSRYFVKTPHTGDKLLSFITLTTLNLELCFLCCFFLKL